MANPRLLLNLFRLLILPSFRLLVGIVDWLGQSDVKKLEVCFNKTMKCFLGLPRGVPTEWLEGFEGGGIVSELKELNRIVSIKVTLLRENRLASAEEK